MAFCFVVKSSTESNPAHYDAPVTGMETCYQLAKTLICFVIGVSIKLFERVDKYFVKFPRFAFKNLTP
jgi:hypothetical protein